MKKIINNTVKVIVTLFTLMTVISPVCAVERFEDNDVTITSKLSPQYLGWVVHSGSTTQTYPMYYKVSAVVPGVGETLASPVTTAYTTYTGLCSTNSLRMMWADVDGASSYKLYRSADNVSFYLIKNTTLLTFVDKGEANGAAYSAPSPRGGNLTVEGGVTAGGTLTGLSVKASGGPTTIYSRSSAQILALDPTVVGELYFCNNCSPVTVCVSTGTAVLDFADLTDVTAACN